MYGAISSMRWTRMSSLGVARDPIGKLNKPMAAMLPTHSMACTQHYVHVLLLTCGLCRMS